MCPAVSESLTSPQDDDASLIRFFASDDRSPVSPDVITCDLTVLFVEIEVQPEQNEDSV